MTRAPAQGAGRPGPIPLGASTAAPGQKVEHPALISPTGEVVIDGRHYLLVPLEEAPADSPGRAPAIHLTARELQIASLVADGLVNKQIAAVLCISEWTVSTHLRRIFAKLDVDTRAAMVGRCAAMLSRPGQR